MPQDIYAVLAGRIRAERGRAGLSIEKLAEAAGIGSSFLGHIETGTRKPSLATIARLAAALEIAVADFFKDVPANRVEKDHSLMRQFSSILRNKTAGQKTVILSTLKALDKSLPKIKRGAGKSRPR